MQLTPQQRRFFDTFGYLAFPGLLADRIDAISAAFEEVWRRNGGGHAGRPHDGERRSCIMMYQHADIVALIDDPRLVGIATGLLGPDYNFMGGDGNYYVGDTPWHSDGWHLRVRHIKIAFYLDPLTRDSGCLRVIPGSHRVGEGYAEALKQSKERPWIDAFGVDGRDVPAVALENRPGDVVVFDHNIKHASFGGGKRRRMFTMNLCQRYPDELLGELRQYLEGFARFWMEEPYHPAVTSGAPPARRRLLEQVLANFGHVPALVRRKREEMPEPSRG